MAQGRISSRHSEKVTCEINLKLPSLNDYISACRTNRYKASAMKRGVESDISFFIGRLPRYQRPVRIHFHWVEKNSRRDLDNVAFAKKFILDAMVKKGKLIDDSQKHVIGFTDSFEIGKDYKVIIEIEEA